MIIVRQALSPYDPSLERILVHVDRFRLAKRLWRGFADDGQEFGCELEKPLQPGDTLFQNERFRYVLEQDPEPVLEIDLGMPVSAVAGVAWAIGNLHLELMSEPGRLLAPDEKAVRRLLDRIGVGYRETTAVFRPGRFARTDSESTVAAAHDLGPSHKH